MNILRINAHANAPVTIHNTPSPSTAIEVSFGSNTRVGYGGDNLGYNGAGTLSIISGNGLGHWNIDAVNLLVPKNGTGVYGSAPPTFSGPYSLVVTDSVSFTKTVNITILVGDVHTVPRNAASDPNKDGTVQDDGICELFRYLRNPTWVNLGKTIWCRNGQINPTGDFGSYRVAPVNAAQRSGSGRLTIRSVNPDTSVDEHGHKNRMHGFKIGRMYWEPDAATVLPLQIDWVDVSWYFDGGPIGQMYLFGCNNASNWSDMGFYNCGWKYGPTVTDYTDNGVIGPVHSFVTIDHNTFRRIGICITTVGIATLDVDSPSHDIVITNNVCRDLRDGDFLDCGGNTWNFTVEDNLLFEFGPVNGGHVDFIQTQWQGVAGWSTPKYAFGTVRRNTTVGGADQSQSQGLFMADITGTQYTSIVVENNILSCGGQQISAFSCNNASVSCNTCLSNEASATIASFAVGSGANATIRRNLSNSVSITQTGTVTQTPNPQTTVSHTTAAIQAIFPNYVDIVTDYSLANINRMWTPSIAGYAAINQSSSLDPSGNWNPSS